MNNNFEIIYCAATQAQPFAARSPTRGRSRSFDLKVKGKINDHVKDNMIYYIAAAPADFRATYTGSGLPFYNQLQAFDNTPNKGKIKLDMMNNFEIDLMIPNSYYVALGSVLVKPMLYISYYNGNNELKTINIKLSNGIPYRFLTYPNEHKNVQFYNTQLKIRSQEEILRSAGYPKINIMPDNYWGEKPPL